MRENHVDMSGENNPMYGNGHRIAGSKNGMYGVHRRGKDHPNYGRKLTQEQKDAISRRNKGKGGVPVYCIELNKTFNSIAEAGEKCNITASNISACIHGKQKTAGRHPVTGERLHWEKLKMGK